MVRILRMLGAYACCIPRNTLSLRAWRWLLMPVALLSVVAATCSTGGGTVIPNFRCPVDGSTYTDSYGPRSDGSFHYAIDILAPPGPPTWPATPRSQHSTL